MVEVEINLRLAVSRPVYLGVRLPSGAHYQIFVSLWRLRVSWCGAPSLTRGRVCILLEQLLLGFARAVTLGSKPHRTHDNILRSMQCNVEFGYQLSICPGAKETHEEPWSSWTVAGPPECKLTSSQQSGIKYSSPNISPYLCCCFFFFFSLFFPQVFLQIFLCSYNFNKYQTVYNTCGRNERIYEQTCIQIYIYLYLWFFDYRFIGILS
jgi:hypothetical protein